MAVLDRVFATTNFEAFYPSANVKRISRSGSDHVPLVVNFCISQERKPYLFLFEKWWLEQEGFIDIVRDTWTSPCHLTKAIDIWQFKLRALRRKLKGWSININADLKKKKQALLAEFNLLDVFNTLEESERMRMEQVKQELEHFGLMEEIEAK
jgi:hypothetical protein